MMSDQYISEDDALRPPQASDNYISEGAALKKPNKGFVGDMGTSLKIGTEQLPGQIAGVADILPALVTGTRPVTAIADYIKDKTGFAPGDWANDAQAEYSPQYNQAQQEIGAAWDDPTKNAWDVAKAYVTHPDYIANQVANSLPSMLAAGAVARPLMLAGRVALPAAEGAAEGAATQFAPGYLEKAVGDKWAAPVAGGIGEGAQQAGQQMQQYKGDDQQRNAIAAVVSGAVDALISTVAGHFANKFGFETPETAMAHGFDQQAKQELVGLAKYGTPGRMLGGALSEGILQELPQSAQEQVWQNWADNKPLWDGVARQAVEGAMAGFVMGAGANVVHRPEAPPPPPPPADTQQQPPPPGTQPPPPDGSFTPDEIAAFRAEQAANQQRMLRDQSIQSAMNEVAPNSNNVVPPGGAAPVVSYPDAHPLTIQGAVNAGNLSGAIPTNPEEHANATSSTQTVTAETQQQEAPSPGQTSAVDQGAHLAATSPLNDQAEPSPDQKAAGNYKVGRANINGLDISIENPQGSVRSSHPDATPQWQNTMQDHYGYFTGVPARAPDKDHVDTFVKPGTPDTFNGDAFIIDQKHPDTGKFDEPKVMVGYDSQQQAQDAYHANYQDGWQGMMGITPVPMDKLKTMLQDKTAFMQPQAQASTVASAADAPATATTPATTPAAPAAQTAPLAVGDRVTKQGQPDIQGTVAAITEHPQLGTRAEVNWDNHTIPGTLQVSKSVLPVAELQKLDTTPTTPVFDNPLHQRVSDIYKQMLAEGQPKDSKIPAELWREQTQEQIDNPTRYSQVAEDDNPLGLRIGDKAEGKKADGTPLDMGIVTSIVGNAPRAYKGGYMVHTTRGGWSGIDDLQKVAATTPEKAVADTPHAFTTDSAELHRQGREYFSSAESVIKGAEENTPNNFIFKTTELNDVTREIEAHGFTKVAPKLWENDKGFTVTVGNQSSYDKTRTEVSLRPADKQQFAGQSVAQLEATLAAHNQQQVKSHEKREHLVKKVALMRRIALLKEQQAARDARKEMADALNKQDNQAQAAQKQAQAAQHRAEKETFTALAGMQELANTVANTPHNFRAEAEAQVVKQVGTAIKAAFATKDMEHVGALSALLADGKPTLPDAFYDGLLKEVQQGIKQKQQTDLVEAAKSAMVLASASTDDKAAFEQGWNHALAGKTKSTLPNGDALAKGYAAASAWLKTDEGKAAYSGKRGKKLENTGADLRRWYEQQKAKVTDGDTETILANLENATTRAELFRDVLPADATPGATRWLEGVRNKILPFKRWLTEKGTLRHFDTYVSRSKSDTDKIRLYLDGKIGLLKKKGEPEQSREERIKTLKDAADEYVTQVALLTDKLRGSQNIAELAKALDNALLKPGAKLPDGYWSRETAYSDEGKQIATIAIDDWKLLRLYGEGQDSYNLRNLALHEKDTIESTRKAALTPPRLDRVDRDGEDLRKGKNITPEQFKRKLGFADVGFGKWVGARQDQDHLNYAYDALLDLARMVGLPPEAIGLGHRLHFTIGALGHGKFAAHYSPEQPHPDGGTVPVINVTNTRGDGTVAHEWSHALDLTPQVQANSLNANLPLNKAIEEIKNELRYGYNFDRLRASVVSMLKGDSYWTRDKNARKTEDGRILNAERAIDHYAQARQNLSNYYKEALKLDGNNKKDPYWSNHKEIFARAFEAWIGDTMEHSNTYLVNPAWSGDGVVTSATHRGTPYPVGDERERFNQWFSALAKSLRYDAEKKLVTLDPEAWQENKPKTRAEWKQTLDDLRAQLPSMVEGLKREAEMLERQQADENAHADSMQVGDLVRAREGRETTFSNQFGVGGAVISKIHEGGSPGSRMLYFDGAQSGIYARNAEVVQRRADIEAQAQAAAAEAAPSNVAPVGELSEGDLSSLFDEAAAELQESKQEQQPELDQAGEPSLSSNADIGQKELDEIMPDFMLWDGKAGKAGLSGMDYLDAKEKGWHVIAPSGALIAHGETKADAIKNAIKWRDEQRAEQSSVKNKNKTDQTASQLAVEAAKLGVHGINEALTGLAKLFGAGPGKLHSFPGHLDKATYDAAKPHFIAALQAFQDAGKTVKELFKFLIENFGMGVKPYAVHFAQEMKLTANLGSKPSASRTVANYIKAKLDTGLKVSWQDLFNRADAAWSGTQAAGIYTVKDAYDAMELGVNLYLRDKGIKADTSTEGAVAEIKRLTALIDNLPTQTKRTAEHDEFQQFSTPPSLAYAASWVANIKPSDTLLEPSAGTGDLAIYADNAGAKLILNELSSRRAELLRELFPDARVFTENGEQLNNVLPADAVPTVVVMNPPFSATAGRVQGSRDSANGAKHIEQALKRLPENGRLVAIIGSLPNEWLAKIKQSYNVRAMIDVSGKEYAKYGTTFDNQIIVIDNDGKTANDVITGRVESVAELPKLLEGIRNDKPIVAQSATTQPGSSQNPETNRLDAGSENATGGSTTDAVGAGSEPAGAGAGVGDGAKLQRPLPELGGSDNQSGKNQTATADATTDGDERGGQLPDRPGRDGTGRSGVSADAGTDNVGAGAAGNTGVTVNEAEKQKHEGELTNAIFENYHPQRLAIPGATDHPGALVQSAAMASVEPPAPTYTPNLPQAIIDGKTPWTKWVRAGRKWVQEKVKGAALSLAQLESIVYAGMTHALFLPNGERRAFFIGDGTGVGKGREIAGIILDNLRQGRKKAVWVSASEDLINDAKRDFANVGGDPSQIVWHGDTKAGNQIKAKDGVLFSAYTTLRGGEKKQANDHGQKEGQKRIDQLVNWLGKDFDGVIVFDESHAMGNLLPSKGKRGKKKPALMAIAGANLQTMLPKARIVYVSATAATEVSNLAYASRLGLWGEGTPFPDVKEFISNIAHGGVASMELISRDMKALGMYIARSLSYDGVTYRRLEHQLTPLQNDIYNELAKAWQGVLQNVEKALNLTQGAKNGTAKSNAMSAFWGSHQRFFNQVITSLQTPTVIEDIKQKLAAGHAIVIQLTNTNEATQEREVAKAAADGTELEELDFTPRQMLMDYVTNSFPVQAYERVIKNLVVSFEPVLDAAGNPVFDKDAIALRDKLLQTLEQIRVPENPLDAIIAAFGSENVGEVTGRKRRFVQQRDDDGNIKVVEEKRGKHANDNDATDYQNDKKRILVFSQAGGTGFSFHADNTAINQRKRSHYVLQAGWRADAAVQGFGRSHRTNQRQPPEYILPSTNLKAQKRFISSIARRLDQLGALTKGERKTASQGLFSSSDNLESRYADDALEVLFRDMQRGATPLNFGEITKAMGLKMTDPITGQFIPSKLPEIPQFLNRLLSLQSHEQDAVFAEFEKRLDEVVNIAKQNGVYDNGMETLKANSIKKVRDEVAHTDPRTGAQTRYVEVDVSNPIKYQTWESAKQWADDNKDKFVGWFKNAKGKIFVLADLGERVAADGTTVNRGLMVNIRAGHATYIDNLKEVKQGYKWVNGVKKTISTELTESEAHKAWEAEVAAAPKNEIRREHMIVGVILPVWDRVMGHPQIVRLQTDDGERMIGRIMGPKDAKATLKNLGLGSSVSQMSPDKMLADIHAGAKALLANGWEIAQSKVSNENRIEITKTSSSYFSEAEKTILTQQGAFVERIQWSDRVFIPTGEHEAAVFERIIQSKPVVDMLGGNKDGEADKGMFAKAPSEAGAAPARKGSLEAVQQAIQPLRAQWRGVRDIHVVQSANDLPVNILFHVMRAGGTEGMQGWYDTGTKAVYLVADNLRTPEEAKWVAIHEVVGHRGIRMLGKPVADVLDYAGRNVFVGKLARAIAEDRNEPYEPQMHTDEALAELAAATLMNNPDALWKRYGVTVPSAMRNGIEGIIGRVIEAVRNFVAKLLGTPADQVSNTDIRKLLLRMKDAAAGFDSSQSFSEAMQQANQYPTETRQGREPSEYEQALKEAGILKSTPAQARLYSQLHRAINDAPAKIFSSGKAVAMWLQANQAKLGVKSDELYWTGINDWLHTQGKVSKDDVLNYLDHNGVQVQERMLGGNAEDLPMSYEDLPASMRKLVDAHENGDTNMGEFADQAKQLGYDVEYGMDGDLESISKIGSGAENTKHHTQVLPGGQNYRELLLKLPVKNPVTFDPAKVEIKSNRQSTTQGTVTLFYDGKLLGSEGYSDEGGAYDDWRRPKAYWMNAARTLFEKGEVMPGGHVLSEPRTGVFTTSHYPDHQNILAHVRFNERTDADGKRVLFVEEIQSDWGERGRKVGFAQKFAVIGNKGERKFVGTQTEANEFLDKAGDPELFVAPVGNSGVPAAPFVTDTKAWTALALKKIIAYAAQNGFDRVAWTTGEQQADRYDLSKQIAEINYNRNSDGTYQLKIRTDRSGETIPDSINGVPLKRIPENMLQEVVGKEVAQKIIDGEGEQRQIWDSDKRPLKTLSGLDLKVGGEGMKGYYDGIVPQAASKIIEKFGGKLENVGFGNHEGNFVIIDKRNGKVAERFSTIEDARKFIEMLKSGKKQGYDMRIPIEFAQIDMDKNKIGQQGFALTPAMREQIIGEGMPLFAKAPKDEKANLLARYGELNPEQAKFIPQVVGRIQSTVERAKEFGKDWKKNLVQGIVDQYAPIKEYSMLAYMRARMSKGVASTLEAIFMYGKPRLDENGDITGDFSSKNGGNNGFASVLAKLDGEHDRFLLWVAALRAGHLKSVGLENLWSPEAIVALKTLDQGKLQNGKDRAAAYREALDQLNAYNSAVLKIASQRGLINDATRLMYENMPYVPFYRLSEENIVPGFAHKSGLVNQSAWKRLKGGTAKLNEDLLANMLSNWSHMIEASARNDSAKLAIEAAVKVGAAREVPSGYPGKGTVSFRDNVTTKLEQQEDGSYRRVQDFIPEGQAYIENGVQKISDGTVQQELNVERTFMVDDPHMLDAITSISDNMRVAKPLRLFKHALTIGVTANPAFKLRNLIRDSAQSMALADLSYNPLKNINEGRKLVHFNSETRAKMLFGGGIIRFGSMHDGTNADKARELVNNGVLKEHILDDDHKVKAMWDHYIKPAFDAYQEFGDRGEQVNRAALYDILTKPIAEGGKGMTQGEANYWARDLMDFSMSGKWQAIRFLTQTVPFMNARLQGLYKLGKAYKADKARFGYVVGGVVMTSLMLMFMASRDPDDWKEWQKRDEWDRDNYWWFKVGGHAFKIPKPFEIGAIGTLAERSLEYATDDEMTNKRFMDRVGSIVSQQLSLNPTPQLVKPLIDLWANKDSFSGRPIETFGMNKLLSQDRVGQHTSSVAKLLGSLGLPNPSQLVAGNYEALSPVQIDYLVRSYFSWLGTAATTVLDYGIFKPFQNNGEAPAMTLRDVFFVGNFVESLPGSQSRYVTQMYDQAQQIEQAFNSYRNALKIGDKERAQNILQDNKAGLQQYHRVEEIKRLETVINTKIKLVNNSREMSGDEKRQRLDQLNAQRDTLAKAMHPL